MQEALSNLDLYNIPFQNSFQNQLEISILEMRVSASSRKYGISRKNIQDITSSRLLASKIKESRNLLTLDIGLTDPASFDDHAAIKLSKFVSRNKNLHSLKIYSKTHHEIIVYPFENITNRALHFYRKMFKQLRNLKTLKFDFSHSPHLCNQDMQIMRNSFSHSKSLRKINLRFDLGSSVNSLGFQFLSKEFKSFKLLESVTFSCNDNQELDEFEPIYLGLINSKRLKFFSIDIGNNMSQSISFEKFQNFTRECSQIKTLELCLVLLNMTSDQYLSLVSGLKNLKNLESLALDLDNSSISKVDSFFRGLKGECKIKNITLKLKNTLFIYQHLFFQELFAFMVYLDLNSLHIEFKDCKINTDLYDKLIENITHHVNISCLKINDNNGYNNCRLWTSLKNFESLKNLVELCIPVDINTMKYQNSQRFFNSLKGMKYLKKLALIKYMKNDEEFDKCDFFQSLAFFLSREDKALIDLTLSKFNFSWKEKILLSDGLRISKTLIRLNLDFEMEAEDFKTLQSGINLMGLTYLRMVLQENSISESLVLLKEILLSLSQTLKRFHLVVCKNLRNFTISDEMEEIKSAGLQKLFPKTEFIFE